MSACTVDSFLNGISLQLKDSNSCGSESNKHVRWTREHLEFIICLAVSQLKADRADLFLVDKRIKLQPGCFTTVCPDCDSIRAPIILEGQECSEIDVIDSEDAEDLTWANSYFDSFSCPTSSSASGEDEEYVIESVIIDPEDPCKINISPEVPNDGKARYIIARCVDDSEVDFDGDLPAAVCENLNAFTQLVLYYAYDMDGMVNNDSSISQQYMRNYIDLINLSIDRDLSLRDRRVLFGQVAANLGSD